jgi:hypothetical protein
MFAHGVVRQPRPSTIAADEMVRLLYFWPCPGSKAVPALRHVDRVPNVVVREHAAFRDSLGKRPSIKVAHALGARVIGSRHDVPPEAELASQCSTPRRLLSERPINLSKNL